MARHGPPRKVTYFEPAFRSRHGLVTATSRLKFAQVHTAAS
jgi:hypothetical protein